MGFRRILVRVIAIAAPVTLLPLSAQAVPTTFFGEDLNPTGSGRITLAGSNSEAARNAFLSSLTGVGTEDFEAFTGGTGAPLALSFPGSAGAITATLTGSGQVDTVPSGTSGAGRWPTSGDNYWTTNATSGAFAITFSDPIAAFGFYATDVGDFAGQITLTLTDGGTTMVNVGNTTNAPNASLLFFGLIDAPNPFVRVDFGTTAGDDYFGFDDMTIGDRGQVVPEPGTLLLLGSGLVGLGFVRSRRAA